MSHSDKVPARIRAADVGRAEPWRLPQVQGSHRVALVQREPSSVDDRLGEDELPFGDGKLTLAELERIREEARQEGFDEGRREGLEQGLEEGRAQGREEGLQQGQQAVDQAVARLGAMVAELEAPLESQAGALENCLLQLVTRLAETVVRHELSSRPELILATLQEAVAQLPGDAGPVRIHVNPEHEVLLQPLCDRHEHWTLVPDAAVAPGGCIVHTANSRVDQTVDSLFRQAADQLRARLGDD